MEAAAGPDEDLVKNDGKEIFTFLLASYFHGRFKINDKINFESLFCWKYKQGDFHLICWRGWLKWIF